MEIQYILWSATELKVVDVLSDLDSDIAIGDIVIYDKEKYRVNTIEKVFNNDTRKKSFILTVRKWDGLWADEITGFI